MTSPLRSADFVVRVLGFLRRDVGSCLLFSVCGLVLRGVPELLVSRYPVGYETITYYAPALFTFAGRGLGDVFVGFFRSGPLFYVLMWLVVNVFGVHPFVVLKVVGPVLYGCLAVSFFVFVRRGLRLEWRLAFVASLLLVVQMAALREGWDRFRTVLGLVFVFGGLTALRSGGKWKWGLLAVFCLLAALSREYVALVLFVVVLGVAFWEKQDRVRSAVTLGPALSLFAVAGIPNLYDLIVGYVSAGLVVTRGFWWTVGDAFVILLICYLGLLPFVVVGWRHDRLMRSMAIFLLLGSFSVVFPFVAIPGYQRWLMLLVFPFCVFAVWGFEKLGLFDKRRLWMLVAVVLGFIIVGSGYSTGAFSYVGVIPNSYVAVNLVGSSIPWDQVDDVKAVLAWLDVSAASDSSILTEDRFYGWVLLYLERANKDVKVVWYGGSYSPFPVLEETLEGDFSQIYFLWYSGSDLMGFRQVYSCETISILCYDGESISSSSGPVWRAEG